jgi:Uma2 family endonuclease
MLKIPHAVTTRAKFTFIADDQQVEIPEWVSNLEAFRHWARSDEFPERGRICYLNGEVWVDMSMEQVFTHNTVKSEFTAVLLPFVRAKKIGRYFSDGVLISNESANLSSQPDGSFVSFNSLSLGRLRLVSGVKEGIVELDGTPDMVLEVISASSVGKDTDTLRELYWTAGIPEYWLVDARGVRLAFDIFRRTAKGYVATRKTQGWLKSAVFDKFFRLRRFEDERGNPDFTLEVK